MVDDILYTLEADRLNNIKKEISMYHTLFFYGAGLRSEEILQMQNESYNFLRRPDAFLVSDMKKNNEESNSLELDGIPVYEIDSVDVSDEECAVLVIAMDIYHEEIGQKLELCGCKNIYYFTNSMEHILTRDFLSFYFQRYNIQFDVNPFIQDYQLDDISIVDKVHTYSVMCEKDAAISENIVPQPWVSSLQAGAALASKRVAQFFDDEGENISDKNPYYNELTGLYWVWKNTNHPYSGICHYRRRFESNIALEPLMADKADVVLPLPFVIYRNLKSYYLHWGEESYYDVMLEVIKDIRQDYYETALWCASHIVFIPNNICIARRDIFDDYCEFIFDVIDEVERRMLKKTCPKQKRCWLSEHVTTIYFMKHLKDYRIIFSNLRRYW